VVPKTALDGVAVAVVEDITCSEIFFPS
jgi:hypothetical protein